MRRDIEPKLHSGVFGRYPDHQIPGSAIFKEVVEIPMHVTQGPPIPNHYQSLNDKQRKEAHAVIGQLQYADLWRGAGTLHKDDLVRVDMQGTIAGPPKRYNIQVQVNGEKGHSTIAHADVSETLEVKPIPNKQEIQRRRRRKQKRRGAKGEKCFGTEPR